MVLAITSALSNASFFNQSQSNDTIMQGTSGSIWMGVSSSNHNAIMQVTESNIVVNGAFRSSNVGINCAPSSSYALDVAGNINASSNISAGNLGMFRNRIINGDMAINQRGMTTLSLTGTNYTYLVDRWGVNMSSTASITFSKQSLSSTDTPFQKGFTNSIRILAQSVVSSNYVVPAQIIEGTNVSDLMWGSQYGKAATLSFWVRTKGVSVLPVILKTYTDNDTKVNCFMEKVSITGSEAWQFVTIAIPAPPVTSTWGTTSSDKYGIVIGSYNAGNQTSTLGWTTGNNYPNINIYSTAGNYIEFTGVQFEKGTIATPFEFRPYMIESPLCMRYYFQYTTSTLSYFTTSPLNGLTGIFGPYSLPFQMRVKPTISSSALSTTASTWVACVSAGGGTEFVTSFILDELSTNSIVYINSSMTNYGSRSNSSAMAIYRGNPGAFIGFNAELI